MSTPAKIEIRIAGTIHSGRSYIALMIQRMLQKELGLTVEVQGCDDRPESILRRIEELDTPEGRYQLSTRLIEKNVDISIIDGIPIYRLAKETLENEHSR